MSRTSPSCLAQASSYSRSSATSDTLRLQLERATVRHNPPSDTCRQRDPDAMSSALRPASFRKQHSNPVARCCLIHLPASSIPIGRPCPVLQQKPDDARLFVTCLLGTAAPSPSVLHSKMQGRSATLVR